MAKEIKNGIIIDGIAHELIEDGEKHSCNECSLVNYCTSSVQICDIFTFGSLYVYFKQLP